MAMATAMATVGVSSVNFRKTALPKTASSSRTSTAVSSKLGSLDSLFSGIRISYNTSGAWNARIASPPQPIVARRVCQFTGKKANKANRVSFSNQKTIRRQHVNLQYKKMWWEAGKRYVKLRLSTKALKTIEKYGLDAVAKKAGVDLRKK